MNISLPKQRRSQREEARRGRIRVGFLLNLVLVLGSLFLFTGCPAKILRGDFTPEAKLDPVGPNPTKNPDAKSTECGTDFKVNYTNVNANFGILEVNNTGGCKVTVSVTEDVGGGAVTDIAAYDVDTGIGNITAFPMPQPGGKLVILFKCASSTSPLGCKYSYRFSTAVETANKPANASLGADERKDVAPPGQATGNKCITDPAKIPVIKVISNKLTEATLKVDFTAKSNCRCLPFVVFADPVTDPKKTAEASAAQNGTANGFVELGKDETTQLKAKCGDKVVVNDTCKGDVTDIKISIARKKK